MKPVVETTTSESHSCVNEGLSYSRPGWTSSVVLDTRLARKRRVATLTAARCWKWLDIQTRYHLFFCISKCFQKVFHAGKCRCQAFCDCSITTTFVFFLPNLVNIHLGVRPIDLRHFKLKAMRRHEWRTWRRRRRVAEDRADDPDHHRHLRRRHRHRAHRQPQTSSGWAESLTECLPSSSSSSSLSSTESFGFISTPFSWQLLFYRCLWSRSSKKSWFSVLVAFESNNSSGCGFGDPISSKSLSCSFVRSICHSSKNCLLHALACSARSQCYQHHNKSCCQNWMMHNFHLLSTDESFTPAWV